MAGASYDREKYKVAIPQLDAKLKRLLDENVTITEQTIHIVKTVEEIDTDYQYFKNLTTGYFTAIAGNVEYLTSRQAYIAKLGSDIAEFGFLTADSAEIQNLKVGNLEIGGVSVNIYDFATDARKRATYYLTDLDDGVFVHAEDSDNMEPTDPDAHGVYITDQVDIIRNGTSVSSFGESIRVGNQNTNHLQIDDNSIDFMDGTTQMGYVGTDSARFPIMHVSSRMSVGNKYEWRITPSGSLGLYLM